jgi:predicted dinucleotide-binding enzyme
MKIAFIGCGNVGAPLADHLQRAGHDVTIATSGDASESVKKALARNVGLRSAPAKDAVGTAEVVFIATPYAATQGALANVAEQLKGKILVDCTNPIGPGLSHGLESKQSGSQKMQADHPETKVIKAFTIYGFENFESSAYPKYDVKPAMMFCGDDDAAKAVAAGLIAQLGWEPVDVGGLEQALHLEHMTLLWVRMVRVKGHSPNIVWAALRR